MANTLTAVDPEVDGTSVACGALAVGPDILNVNLLILEMV